MIMRRIFMRKPSKYEKETIINFNEAEDTANIYTFNADLKRRLAESAGNTLCCAGWNTVPLRGA